ncbi:MAG: type III-B CRISPR module RAMP protein Cmr1 [Anaerolineales bacterium]|nr:type III-B CRISPR module RAMP protein Cmr1 [Anaerolineales bacterium]
MARTYSRLNEVFEVKQQPDPNIITQTRTYKLITPLFGGGAQTQKPDEVTTVRATEVRGHLRFWWRATRGGMFEGDLKKMKAEEERIWGSAAQKKKPGPSKVKINIRKLSAGAKDHPFEVVPGNNGQPQVKPRRGSKGHPYSAFPLQPNQNDGLHIGMETASVHNDVSFILEINYKATDEIQDDINAALWAWETFGGIGGRTRRGFGALQCTMIDNIPETPPSYEAVAENIRKGLNDYVTVNGNWYPGVPYLSVDDEDYKLTESKTDVAKALKDLLDALKGFRQSRREGNNPNAPGRSYWPEPENIREIKNQRIPRHQPLPNQIPNKFPRAKFGLPIIFHFKDINRQNPAATNFDPSDTSLEGAEFERLASPLILRPLACAKGAVGLAIRLNWRTYDAQESYTPPGGLMLKGAGNHPPLKSDLTPSEANDIPPLKDKSNDVLQAFLDYLK